MRVLYVTKKLPFGLDEAFILAEIAEHRASGWEVTIAPVQSGKLLHEEAAQWLPFTLDKPLVSGCILLAACREFLLRPALVLGVMRDLVAGSRSLLILVKNLAVLPKGLWLAGEVRKRGIAHIHAHWLAVPSTMALIAARVSGSPLSITAHRYDIAQNNLVTLKAQSALFVRAIDTAGAAEISATLPPGHILPVIVHMGVRIPKVAAALRDGDLPRPRGLIAARLVEKKGHAVLLEALARARAAGIEVQLDVFGDGPLHTRLKRQADKLDLEQQVRFCGGTSHGTVLVHLESGDYDFAVLPSLTAAKGDKEGIPVFLMEAMAAGLPVIATRHGGIPELVTEGCGLLVPEKDPEALAGAILNLAQDAMLRRGIAAGGRERVRQEFAVTGTAGSLRHLVEALAVPEREE